MLGDTREAAAAAPAPLRDRILTPRRWIEMKGDVAKQGPRRRVDGRYFWGVSSGSCVILGCVHGM